MIDGKCLLIICLLFSGYFQPVLTPDVVMEEDTISGAGVKLTRPDGTAIYVNPHGIAFVRDPLEGESGNATIVFTSGAKQSTKETVQEIIEIIAADRDDNPPP
jgi:uncharacterized protein YlzI (FlbEa/FlbD family)